MSSVSFPRPQTSPATPTAEPSQGISFDIHMKVNVSPEAIRSGIDTILANARGAGVDVTGLLFKGVAAAVSKLGAQVGHQSDSDAQRNESFVGGALRGVASMLAR